jgi:hypothetical protein
VLKILSSQRNGEMYRFLKKTGITYLVLTLLLLSACSLGGGNRETIIYYKPTFYEYNIAQKTYSKILSLDEVVSRFNLYYQYFPNNDHKIVYVDYYTRITILDVKSKTKTSIDLDSLIIQDNFFSISPKENKITFAAARKNVAYGEGLYLLDLDTREIIALRSDNNDHRDTAYVRYHHPTFSNKGNLISYFQFHSYINNAAISHPWVCENIIFNVDLSSTNHKKIFRCGEDYYYSLFDKTDQNIILIGTDLLKFNLASVETDTIVNNHLFQGYDTGFPPILVTFSGIYYTWVTKAIYPQKHEIYLYDSISKETNMVTKGFLPMSENSKNGNILIRADSNVDDPGSVIQIINKDGELIEKLKSGVRAIFSPDGNNILLLTLEVSTIDT